MNEKVYMYGITRTGCLYASSGIVTSDFKNTNSAIFYESGTELRCKCSKTEGEVLNNRVWYKKANLETAVNAFLDYEIKKINKLERQLELHKKKRSMIQKCDILERK